MKKISINPKTAYNFLCLLNNALKLNNTCLTFKITQGVKQLLQLLWKLGFIDHFYKKNNKCYTIIVNNKWMNAVPLKKIKFISKNSRKNFLKLKSNIKFSYFDNIPYLFLNTKKGLLIYNKAQKYNLGGEQLFLLYA